MNYFENLYITILESTSDMYYQGNSRERLNARKKANKRYTPRGKAYKEARKLMYAKRPIRFKEFLDNGGFGEVLSVS